MKRLTAMIALVCLLTLPALAQENKRPRFNPEEFKAKMETFISQKAGLTQEESGKLLPIFQEMKEKQRNLKQKEHKAKKDFTAFDNEKKCQEVLLEITEIHEELAEIEENYYKKMCKAVSAQKAYKVMLADDAFHREMLQHAYNNKQKRHNPHAKQQKQ